MAGKKILYIASGRGFRSDAPPRKIEKVIEAFSDSGHEVESIFGGDFGQKTLSQSVYKAVSTNKAASPLFHSASEIRDVLHDRLLERIIEIKVKENKPDIIWERTSRLHGAGLRVSKRNDIVFVMEWLDNLTELYGFSLLKPLADWVETNKIRNSDYVVVYSKVLRDKLAKNLCLDKRKFVIAVNGVDVEEFKPCVADKAKARKKYGIGREDFVVAYVGKYAWYQNVEMLVAAADILRKTASRVTFLMVGDGGNHRYCQELADKLGLTDWFRFLGRKDKQEVPGILAAANVAILPDCLDIILPIKVQEYMAMGLAPIVPAYAANREVIAHNENGVLFTPKSPVDIAAQIEYLLNNKEVTHRLGNAARKYAEEHLTWEKTWGNALEEIIRREQHKKNL